MKNFITSGLIISILVIGSGGYAAETHNHSHENQTEQSSLSLNNGERWLMDDHTRNLSKQMQDTFFAADHSTLEGLNKAGKALETQMQSLISGCTMSGKAHDQLHLFLNSHIPTIDALAKADNYDAAREQAIRLKGQFEAYQKHFK